MEFSQEFTQKFLINMEHIILCLLALPFLSEWYDSGDMCFEMNH